MKYRIPRNVFNIITIILILALSSIGFCLAEDNSEVISTYFPTPNIVVRDFIATNFTVSDKAAVAQNNLPGEDYLAVRSKDPLIINQPVYIGSQGSDFEVRFLGNSYVDETTAYICNTAGGSCRGIVEGEVNPRDYPNKLLSVELEGIALTRLPVLENGGNRLINIPGFAPPISNYEFCQDTYYRGEASRSCEGNNIKGLRNRAYQVLKRRTDQGGNAKVRYSHIGGINTLTRRGGWYVGFGFGVGNGDAYAGIGLGMELIPPFYTYGVKRFRYDLNPCYYDELHYQCTQDY